MLLFSRKKRTITRSSVTDGQTDRQIKCWDKKEDKFRLHLSMKCEDMQKVLFSKQWTGKTLILLIGYRLLHRELRISIFIKGFNIKAKIFSESGMFLIIDCFRIVHWLRNFGYRQIKFWFGFIIIYNKMFTTLAVCSGTVGTTVVTEVCVGEVAYN